MSNDVPSHNTNDSCFNRLIGSNNTSRNSGNSNHNSQMIYHKSNDDHNENVNNEIRHTMKEGRGKKDHSQFKIHISGKVI